MQVLIGFLWKHSREVKMYACPERGPIPDENMQTAATPMKTCVAPAHMERPRTC